MIDRVTDISMLSESKREVVRGTMQIDSQTCGLVTIDPVLDSETVIGNMKKVAIGVIQIVNERIGIVNVMIAIARSRVMAKVKRKVKAMARAKVKAKAKAKVKVKGRFGIITISVIDASGKNNNRHKCM
jgi:hypothetical protein